MSVKKRVYNSDSRVAQAEKTKKRVLEKAKKLFKKEGFDRVTIASLAKEAKVSVPTIYSVFKSKRGVLQALIDGALPERDFAFLVESVHEERCPRERLNLSAKIARQIYDAEKELVDILRSASMVAPELKELEQEREKRRYDRQGDSIKKMKTEGSLAKGLSLAKARDVFWAVTGRDMYRLLVIERAWTSEQYEDWLAKTLPSLLMNEEWMGHDK